MKQSPEDKWRIEHYYDYVKKYGFKLFGSELWKQVKKDEVKIPEPKIYMKEGD